MVAASFLGGGLASVGFAGKDSEVTRARAFEAVDTQGKVRGALSLAPDGSVGLMLYDEKGEVLLSAP